MSSLATKLQMNFIFSNIFEMLTGVKQKRVRPRFVGVIKSEAGRTNFRLTLATGVNSAVPGERG
jgi:hypothetical protein